MEGLIGKYKVKHIVRCTSPAAKPTRSVTNSQHAEVAARRGERIHTHDLLQNAMYGAGYFVAMENSSIMRLKPRADGSLHSHGANLVTSYGWWRPRRVP
eukprot:SM000477S16936  [mRNA]  locus=s477:4747:5051:- [translate_table: standard]